MSNLAEMIQLARGRRKNWDSHLRYAKVKAIEVLCPVSYVSCLEFHTSTTGFWGWHHAECARIQADSLLVLGDQAEPGGNWVIHIPRWKNVSWKTHPTGLCSWAACKLARTPFSLLLLFSGFDKALAQSGLSCNRVLSHTPLHTTQGCGSRLRFSASAWLGASG